jgi:hypothetical protein
LDVEALYAQLLILSGQSFLAGHHKVACHLLHAAVHCAFELSDPDRLAEAGQVARNRELWLIRQSLKNAESFRFLVHVVEEMLQDFDVPARLPPPERRVAPRRRILRPEPLQLFAPDGLLLGVAVTDDVSESGIRMLVANAFAPEEVLLVEATRQGVPAPRFAFQVAWCEALDMGYRVAGPFVPPMPTADTLALLDGGETTDANQSPA